jgi:hypothetical protein
MGIYDSIINSIPLGDSSNTLFPGEMHLPLYTSEGFKMGQFIGPKTNLITRLKRGDKGVSDVDRTAKRHDIEFTLAENIEQVRSADLKMLENLRKIRARGSDYSINISAAESGIENKLKGEMIGLLQQGSFSSKKGASLSITDRKLLLDNLKQLEQEGFGSGVATKPASLKHKARALYGSEIQHLLNNLPNFLGVYSKDQIKNIKFPKNSWSFVYNLQDSDERGSHWIAVNCCRKTPYIEHLDSFGIIPDRGVSKVLSKIKPVKYSDNQLQGTQSILCGFFCVEYLLERRTKSPDEILSEFTTTPSFYNEKKVLDDTI